MTESPNQWNAYASLMIERLQGFQPGSAARAATDSNTFDPAEMKRERTALFIIGSARSDLSRTFVGAMTAAVIERFADAHGSLRALVVGEEWGQLYVSNFPEVLTLYRQAQIFARQGVVLDRSTLADWVGRAAFLLRPVHERLLETLKRSGKLFADETTAPVLDPGRGRTKTGHLWAYARDDRPWGGSDPPGVAYVYAPDRTAGRPIAHLVGFEGVLQVDGYGASEVLAKGGTIRLASCWSHARRLFYELAATAPTATEALARIAALYRIEAEIRGRPAGDRRAVRQERSRPVIEALEPWLREKLGLISPKSKLADAIRYALSRWAGLSLFLDDGRVEIDSNVVERTVRPLALNRKNALLAGSDGGGQHWAVIASLVETCKLVGIEPQAYLADVITRIVEGHPQRRLDDLLPWAYACPFEVECGRPDLTRKGDPDRSRGDDGRGDLVESLEPVRASRPGRETD